MQIQSSIGFDAIKVKELNEKESNMSDNLNNDGQFSVINLSGSFIM